MLIDQFLPRYDFNEVHSIDIDASAEVVYDTLFSADLGSPLIVRVLMGVRSLPTILRTGAIPRDRKPLTLADVGRAGFTLLAKDPSREVALGIEGRFWKLKPDLCATDAAAFAAPVPSGVARAIWNFSIESLGANKSRLSTETRILCGDSKSRRRFGLYWTLIQPGSAVIRWAILNAIKTAARQKAAVA